EKKLTIETAVDTWYGQAQKQWTGAGPVPLVIVATAGGASRAGYWTAKVLGEIEDAHPDFHKYVFAISSVSGGSLGTAVWRAMLEDEKVPCADELKVAGPSMLGNGEGSFARCAGQYFSRDFLAPTFLTGL